MENVQEETGMMRPLRLLFMNRRYENTYGGVERASIRLANEMAARGHECHLLSLDISDTNLPFAVDGRVQWHRVSTTDAQQKASWSERFRRLSSIRKILLQNHIDVAMGFQDGAYLSLATASVNTNVSVIAAERNAPSRFAYISNKMAPVIAFNSFRFADAITVQCPSYLAQYPSYLQGKIKVIPNSVDAPIGFADPKGHEGNPKELLFVGRLDYQKNVSTLIDAYARIASDFPLWKLRIVGAGPDLVKLQSQVRRLFIEKYVFFDGVQNDVENIYRRANLFCLPSLWEGFPNVLGEAMSHGLPAVGFRKCSGVCDLISHERSGLLVDGDVRNDLALSNVLRTVMSDGDRRLSMGKNAAKEMTSYLPEKIYGQWEDLFLNLSSQASKP